MYSILMGDCLEEMKAIPDGLVDMVFADLPYGITANKWDSVIPFEPLWAELLRVGKEKAPFIFLASQPFTTSLINSRPQAFRYELVWKKTPTRWQHANRLPLSAHENILIFGSTRAVYNPQKTPRDKILKRTFLAENNGSNTRPTLAQQAGKPFNAVYTHKFPTTIVEASQKKDKRCHPTQKPVALLEWLIKTYSNPGDLILDPTMGSGTTGVACLNTQRHFIGIEKDPTYFETASKRLLEAEGAA